jgi:hypothetical protein
MNSAAPRGGLGDKTWMPATSAGMTKTQTIAKTKSAVEKPRGFRSEIS